MTSSSWRPAWTWPRCSGPGAEVARLKTLVLDNEAVQAATSINHPKHRKALSFIEVTASRNQRRAGSIALVVPTTVRVEAGWDRQAPAAAVVNRLRVSDVRLGTADANRAAQVRSALGVSVVDAHVAAMMQVASGPVAVITSDEADMRRVASHIGFDNDAVIVL